MMQASFLMHNSGRCGIAWLRVDGNVQVRRRFVHPVMARPASSCDVGESACRARAAPTATSS